MNITINQSTSNQEIVNYNIISKLYSLIFGNSQHNVTLSGNLYSATGYKQQIDALVERFSPNLIITVPVEGQYLIFEDPQVESILKNTIGDGIGVSGADAQAVNSIGTLFQGNTNITTFDELRYFTNITSLQYNSFAGDSNLSHINLTNINSIGENSFVNCPSLVLDMSELSTITSLGAACFGNDPLVTGNVNLPNLTFIGHDAFASSGINKVLNLGNITGIPFGCFYNCQNLTEVVIPSSVNSIDARAFWLCSNLNKIVFPKGVYWGYEYQFMGCDSLNKIQINDLVSWYTNGSNRDDDQFPLTCNNLVKQLYDSNGNHITNLVLPEGITTCSNLDSGRTCKAFNRTDITSVTLPSTITELGGFANCTSLTSIDFSNTSSLTTFLQNAFIGCTSLNLDLANLPNSITNLGWNSFGNNPLVHGDINLPNLIGGLGQFVSYTDGNMGIISFSNLGGITTIATDALRGLVGKVKFIVLPSTLTSFSGRNFKVNQYMQCLATTPPAQGEYGWDASNIPYCFVPDASLSAYQSSSAWSSLNLHGMSEFSSLATQNNWDLPTT